MTKRNTSILLLLIVAVVAIALSYSNHKSNQDNAKKNIKNSELTSMVGLVSPAPSVELSEQADYPAPIQQLQQAMTHSMLHEQQENEFLLSNKLPKVVASKDGKKELPNKYVELKSRLENIEVVINNNQ
ncbi:hypothetical protein [Aliivibrio kagoshimensis]|uniref:hypothetical protein n=1 Tax=Aliivibrio kagoshimensis TaxID=2910230 RepID=UPI003D136086